MYKTIQEARARGFRVVKGRSDKEIGLRPMSALKPDDIEWAKKNRHMLSLELSVAIGTTLGVLIKLVLPDRFWKQAELLGCGCDKYEKRMNRWGFYTCLKKIKVILRRLRTQARRMGVLGKILQWTPWFVIDFVSLQFFWAAFSWEFSKYCIKRARIRHGML